MEKLSMKLWIDDVRTPPTGWVWAKTADEAQKFLVLHWWDIDEISFDHDLGETSDTGYDILTWIEQRVSDGHNLYATMYVHSANPVGRRNMLAAIQSIKRLVT